jgi:hypothetical protein
MFNNAKTLNMLQTEQSLQGHNAVYRGDGRCGILHQKEGTGSECLEPRTLIFA